MYKLACRVRCGWLVVNVWRKHWCTKRILLRVRTPNSGITGFPFGHKLVRILLHLHYGNPPIVPTTVKHSTSFHSTNTPLSPLHWKTYLFHSSMKYSTFFTPLTQSTFSTLKRSIPLFHSTSNTPLFHLELNLLIHSIFSLHLKHSTLFTQLSSSLLFSLHSETLLFSPHLQHSTFSISIETSLVFFSLETIHWNHSTSNTLLFSLYLGHSVFFHFNWNTPILFISLKKFHSWRIAR